MIAVFAACGGGGDDDDDSRSPGDSPFGNDKSGDSGSTSTNDVALAKFEDGNFDKGSVHVEITGDKKMTFDVDGVGGLALNGLALLTFSDNDKTGVSISVNKVAGEDPGGIAVTSAELITGGAWGTECTLKLTDSSKDLKGQFECKDVEAVSPTAAKSYKVTVKGNFSVER